MRDGPGARVTAPSRTRQVADGAFYTLPPAAALLGAIANDATAIPWDSPEVWCMPEFWRTLTVLDPCAGTGELMVGWLRDLHGRAVSVFRNPETGHDAHPDRSATGLCRHVARVSVVCMDIDRESLQIAANRLQAPTWWMPHGPQPDGTVKIGTLELLARPTLFGDGFDGARRVHPEPGTEWMFLKTADELTS